MSEQVCGVCAADLPEDYDVTGPEAPVSSDDGVYHYRCTDTLLRPLCGEVADE